MRAQTPERIEARLRTAIDAGDTATIDECAILLDAIDAKKPKPQLLASALWYASVGLHIFPLRPCRKIPLAGSHGCKDGTTDEQQIRDWWTNTPEANIGIATGHLVDVIDIDGPAGVKSWAGMKSLPPIIGKVDTPRLGGTHLYVAAIGDGNSAGIFPGIDYRGIGGYVVAPPSINSEGVTYTWTKPLTLAGAEVAA